MVGASGRAMVGFGSSGGKFSTIGFGSSRGKFSTKGTKQSEHSKKPSRNSDLHLGQYINIPLQNLMTGLSGQQ